MIPLDVKLHMWFPNAIYVVEIIRKEIDVSA